MLGQEFLFTSLEELIDQNSDHGLKKVSRTSLIPVEYFPTIIVEEDGHDYSQEVSRDNIVLRKESYNMAVIVKSVNVNELSEDEYKNVQERLDELSDNAVAKILQRSQTHERISNVRFGRGEKFDGTISSVPVMWNMIPCEIVMVSN